MASSVGRALVPAPYALEHRWAVAGHWRERRATVIGIAVFNPLAYILVLYAPALTPVVYVAPMREVSALLTVLMGGVLLKEGEPGRRAAWAALILAGIALLATG